ncbi:DedA family protein/thiosulfate sulfurtransferase GlpE [Derxia gummosa]|uniref:DedA family protein/thiosulfate sulfurtransferase GlpE n=1 Tax=Derxia gummosa DSM 723 TaxID=1121388 RepID=A0A8B6XCS7_9BURK|nr:DedA family protein/thiosulfate sulfurtransferase GlpE [Derxia gummosa]
MPDLLSSLAAHGYLVVFLVTLAVRLGAPLPAAPVLVVAGGLVAGGQLALAPVLGLAVLANLLGDAAWFWAGRHFGYRILRLLCRISLSPDGCVRQSEGFIGRWGGGSLIAAKFLPGVSVVAAPMAGALGMTLARFAAYAAAAGFVWATPFLALGLVFSDQIQDVLAALSGLGLAAALAAGVAVAGYLAWRWRRRREFLRAVERARISVDELRALLDGGHEPVVIDVRSRTGVEIDPRRIPGALAVGLHEIADHAPRLPRDREIVLYCNCPNEVSAAQAARLLAAKGFTRVRPLLGGLDAWVLAGGSVEGGDVEVDIVAEPDGPAAMLGG